MENIASLRKSRHRPPLRSPGPGLAKEVSRTTNKRQEERNGEQDFLLGELQDLLDHEKSGKVKGEELRRILGSIGDR